MNKRVCRFPSSLLPLALAALPAAALAQEDEEREPIGGDEDVAPLPASGAAVASSQMQDTYVVVPGDTLWEICSRFFADAEYWPTLWSVNNEEISNPHYIYPGQVLKFRPGTDTQPPAIVVAGEAPPIEDLSYDESFQPIVHFLSTTKDCQLYVPFSGDREGDVTLSAPAFMTRSEMVPLGEVVQAVPGKEMLSSGDIVYMRFRNTSDVNCGDIYSLYHHETEVRHPEVRSARLGHTHRVTAEVLVSDVGDRWVTGRVVHAWGEFERGELITDRVPVTGKVRTATLPSDLDGYVIDKSHDENLLIQQNQVVYIDRGRSDGVQSGTVFWVVRRGDGLARSVDDTLPDQVVGRLIVFAADEHVSTAVMTDQALDVHVGDRITSRID
jgi:hypothetical protein